MCAGSPEGERATRRRTRDRLGAIRAGAPKAIGNDEKAAPATMEEVAKRLTDALLKVASNKGASGPDGQTGEQSLERRPSVLHKLEADVLAGVSTTRDPPGVREGGLGMYRERRTLRTTTLGKAPRCA